MKVMSSEASKYEVGRGVVVAVRGDARQGGVAAVRLARMGGQTVWGGKEGKEAPGGIDKVKGSSRLVAQ